MKRFLLDTSALLVLRDDEPDQIRLPICFIKPNGGKASV